MSKRHALLSASGASRWLACTPSPRLEQKVDEVQSDYADEGTLAHEIGEWMIRRRAYGINIDKKLEILMQNEHYNEEMYEYCSEYASFVVDKLKDCPPGARLYQEEEFDLSRYIPEGFGTTDNTIVGEPRLIVIDLKYGKGVPVDAYENSQMKVYALGALTRHELTYDIQEIEMIIYQPRIGNISSYVISTLELLRWARETLRPIAREAWEGSGRLVAGDHCRFCRVRQYCSENAKYNLSLAKRDFMEVALTDEQVVKILNRSDSIKNWLNSLEEWALKEAINGKKWPGLKLVQGRSTRKFTDEQAVISALIKEGYSSEQVVNNKIVGISKLSTLLPKLQFEKFVEPYLIKPEGKPTLVEEDDKRPEWNRLEQAKQDFDIED